MRAKKGGQVGINGERYEGGQFLPSSPETVKGAQGNGRKKATPKPRKQEVAPYKWDFPPSAQARSIYSLITNFATLENGRFVFTASDQAIEYFNLDVAETMDLIEKYNSGQRWV